MAWIPLPKNPGMMARQENAITPKKVPVVMIHHWLRPIQKRNAGTEEIFGLPGS